MLLALDHAKTILKALVLPPGGPWLLAVIGALLLLWRVWLGTLVLSVGLALLGALSIPLVANGLTALAEHYPALDASRPTNAQAIVILGGGVHRAYAAEYRGPSAGPYLLDRLAYGAYLSRRTGLPILVTGWHVEAIAMRDTLERNFGLEPRWVDQGAYDTFDNARDAARMLRAANLSRVLLLTSSTHMWRAAHEFSAAGLSVIPAPVDVLAGSRWGQGPALLRYLPDMDALQRSYDAVYELTGEAVRQVLAFTHLRRQQPVAAPPPSRPPASPKTPALSAASVP